MSQYYQVKSYFWLVFPSKEKAASSGIGIDSDRSVAITREVMTDSVKWWSKALDCQVTYISPNSCFTVIELDGKFTRVIGEQVGWIIADVREDWVRDSFERIVE